MVQPKNKELYEKVEKEIILKYPKHSAYRSGLIVKAYKEAGGTYEGPKPKNTGLKRWFDEKWTNQRGEIGYKNPTDLYRPSKKITSKTPKTWSELNKKQIEKAKVQKRTKGRVKKF